LSASYYVHPEFGYLCPSPGLRRLLRIALLSVAFAAIIVIAVPRTGPLSNDQASNLVSSDTTSVGPWPEVAETDGAQIKGADIKTFHIRLEVNPDATKVAAKSEEHNTAGAIKTTCEDSTWAYLDGKCAAAGKPRWARMRALTDNPVMATVSLGRRAAPPINVDTPPLPSSEQSAPTKAVPETAETAVEAKKPQKTARRQNRTRERYAYPRADYWGSYASYYSDNRRAGLWVWTRGW
jgi:hypothetical protein